MAKDIIRNVGELRPLSTSVFVTDLESGPRLTRGGLIVPDDDVTHRGIRARWCKVYKVGPKVDDLKPGEWVFVSHGRWTNHIDIEIQGEMMRIWRVEYPDGVLLSCDECPLETTKVDLRLV